MTRAREYARPCPACPARFAGSQAFGSPDARLTWGFHGHVTYPFGHVVRRWPRHRTCSRRVVHRVAGVGNRRQRVDVRSGHAGAHPRHPRSQQRRTGRTVRVRRVARSAGDGQRPDHHRQSTRRARRLHRRRAQRHRCFPDRQRVHQHPPGRRSRDPDDVEPQRRRRRHPAQCRDGEPSHRRRRRRQDRDHVRCLRHAPVRRSTS